MIKMDDMEKQRLELNPSRTSKIPEAKQRGVGVHLPPAGDLMEDFDNFCHAECIERSLPSMLRSFAALRMTNKQDVGRNAPSSHTLALSQERVGSTADAQCLRRRNPLQGGGVGGGLLHRTSRTLSRAGGYIRYILVCLMLLLLVVSPVGAQTPTTRLFFDPTPLVIDTTISPSGVVNVEVADGVDIFAFDLFVQYDPSLVSVSQVVVGDFLGEGLFCMDQVNDPGLVHYSCTRFAVDTGVSGSGVLLELTLEALGQGGDTLLSLTGSELYDWPDVQPVVLSLEDGAVSVRPYRIYLPLILSASGQGLEATP